MIRCLLLLLALSGTLNAETARVLSGEHADFTRLVIELPQDPDWTLGRTVDGYAFAAATSKQPDYDLSTVWQRIARSRLAQLKVDPATGALSLILGCDCHVFPFEYGTGIVVLDVKEGPAPKGSVFEAAFAAPASVVDSVGKKAGFDWVSDVKLKEPRRTPELMLPLDTGSMSLEPLRDELLEQIARGAADGIVDMELPGKPPEFPTSEVTKLPWTNIRIGEQPGVTVIAPGALVSENPTAPDCAPPDLLNLPDWGAEQLPHDLLAESRIGIYGEFDVPDEKSVLRSVRQLLFLGFGVEARQTIDLLGPDASGEALPLYRSMARLVDGETDPQTPFAHMLDCEGPAALWAALAHDRLPTGSSVNRDAILQSYQGLPSHLRLLLGPGLAEKFLANDDPEAARMIRDAMGRTPDVDPGAVDLLHAKAKLHEGDTDAAQAFAESAVSLNGDQAEPLLALVEAHFRKLEPMDPDITEALLSMRREAESTYIGPEVERAIVLALALSNQTDAAFDEGGATTILSDLWQVVGARAEDDAFLRKAVLPSGSPRPDVLPEVGQAVAVRLLALGFPDAALAWLGPATPEDAPPLRLTRATAELQRGDARSALAYLAGIDDPEAIALRAQALFQLGDVAGARDALAQAGEVDAAMRASLWEGDWAELDTAAPEVWRTAADTAQPVPADDTTGLLGRGSKSVEDSRASRDAIDTLLASVPSPVAE